MRVETPVQIESREVASRPPESCEVVPSVSVLVPVAEHHDDMRAIYMQIIEELTPRGVTFEVIFVLDGPYFPEAERQIRDLQANYPGVRAYRLNRVFGEAAALRTAAARANGRTILTLAPYFQLARGAIGRVLDSLDDGYDLVVARRHPRIDSWFNRLQSHVFHLLTSWLTGVRLRDISCGLRAMKSEVLLEIPLYGDLHRFIPILAHRQGFRISEVPLQQSPENVRARIYRPGVYVRRLLDILTVFFLTKFTRKPLRFFGLIGAGLFGTGFLITGYLAVLRILQVSALANRPLLLLGVLLMVLGVQTASLGLIGEMIAFTRSREHPDYAVETILE